MPRNSYSASDVVLSAEDKRASTRQFECRRIQLRSLLQRPETRAAAQRELDDLYLAHRMRSDLEPRRVERDRSEDSPNEQLKRLIRASLEGDLLRFSRRRQVLDKARRLGISEFHAHLLIAEVQFGGADLLGAPGTRASHAVDRVHRAAARFAAAGVLALAFFLSMVHWLNV